MSAQPIPMRRRRPSIDLWIAGKAKGKDRPRHRPGGRPFTPKATENAEANIVQVWREQGEVRLPDVALSLDLTIYVERSKGHFTTKGALSTKGLTLPRPSAQKPDVDNALKLVMDALNGRAYKDDVQIVDVAVRRRWADRSGMQITVTTAGIA